MIRRIFWISLPLLIISLAAAVLWQGKRSDPAAAITLPCADLNKGCSTRLRNGEISVGLVGEAKPLAPFQVWVKAAGAQKVQARFTMVGMDMGFNLYTLHADAHGVFRANITLPVCVSGQRDWIMTLEIDDEALNIPFSTSL